MAGRLRDLGLRPFYDAPGVELARGVLLPCLGVACRYDRVSAYFNLASLVSIGEGLDRLRLNGGRMRLLMGAHDANGEVADAAVYAGSEQLVSVLRSRILNGVSTLRDELARDRVEAVAWMMADGLLEIRLVAPRQFEGGTGIFHGKRLIFQDGTGDVITATGSVNETGAGLGGNFEELTVHSSWAAAEYTRPHVSSFEKVWAGEDQRLTTNKLDADFAHGLLAALGSGRSDQRRPARRSPSVVKVLSGSPFLGALNSSRAPLYPHQERVLKAVCSRWPIRAVLADEVGLGKTYEAGAVVSFALRHAGVRRVVVLAPPTLLRQWQDEFCGGFGLDFWRYDSSSRRYISPDDHQVRAPSGPFSGAYPELTIVSRDLARGTRRAGHAFQDADIVPDLLVLDEAHAVRKRRSSTEARPSLVGRMMQDLLKRVPHALFLTATPLQVAASELFDALELLGVPESFDEAAYSRSLELLSAGSSSIPELMDAASCVDLVGSFVSGYGVRRGGLLPGVSRLVAKDKEPVSNFQRAQAAQKAWEPLQHTLLRVHPAAQLCVRTTRETLSRVGYKFPSRVFKSVDCSPTPEVEKALGDVHQYLERNLGLVEAALYPNRQSAVGFVRSTYHQRAASSLAAIHASLERRLDRLRTLQGSAQQVDEFVEEDALDDGSPPGIVAGEAVDELAVAHACAIEVVDIEALVATLERLEPDLRRVDPKLDEALRAIQGLHQAGRSVLVFSRYTDTVEALIARYVDELGQGVSYASYTGEGGLVYIAGTRTIGDKSIVTDALSHGVVDVVFCSDAASEGLNLQSASAIINVDVPWNPARLEQRIGRVARLGQRAESVDIFNLWYSRSVEAKIYQRVLSRKDLMDLALGAFPEIVGSAIRNAVTGGSPGVADRDVIEELNEMRNGIELAALTRMWSAFTEGAGAGSSAELRRAVSDALDEIAADRAEAGARRPPPAPTQQTDALIGPMFTLHEKWVSWLGSLPFAAGGPMLDGRLGVLVRGSTPLTFGLRDGDWLKALAPTALPDVLRALYLGTRPDLSEYVFAEAPEGEPLLLDGSSSASWWPDPEALLIPVAALEDAPAIPVWARADVPVTFVPLSTVGEGCA